MFGQAFASILGDLCSGVLIDNHMSLKVPFALFDRGWVAATHPMCSGERDAPRPAGYPELVVA
jgi:hypothetical protein